MEALLATENQKKEFEGAYKNGAILQFIKDADNNWVVNDNVLSDSNFEGILEKLNGLKRIPLKQKKEDNIQ